MTDKKDLTDDNMTGMPKPSFDINKNPFRDGDSLVDAVRAVLSGQPVTQEQKAELEKENPAGLKDKRTQQEEQVSIQEATLVDINFDAGEYKRTGGEKSLKQHKLKIKIEKGKGSFGADKATLTGQDGDLIAYAKKHLGADGRNLKDVQKQLESIEEAALGFAKNKEYPGKDIAKKMKAMGRPMAGQAPKVAKMKKVTWRQLDLMLPDMIAGKDIAALFTEDASNDKSDDGKGLDKADPKAAKKKFDDRKDKDIDNDGDTDDSDKYLHKKRKAITKAVAKEVKEKAKDYVLAVNPKDPKAKRGGGVQKVKKRDWPKLQKKGWILAEQATVYIDPEEKCIEVDFGPAEDLDNILVEGMMYEKSMGKLKPVKNFKDDEVRSWGMNDFREWLASIVDVAKTHVYFHSGDIKFEYPEKVKEDERKYKYVTKVVGKKVEELVKAIEKTPK